LKSYFFQNKAEHPNLNYTFGNVFVFLMNNIKGLIIFIGHKPHIHYVYLEFTFFKWIYLNKHIFSKKNYFLRQTILIDINFSCVCLLLYVYILVEFHLTISLKELEILSLFSFIFSLILYYSICRRY